jgi:PcfJ-like protein
MVQPAIKYPVELLRNGKGIYGIGVAKEVEIDHRPRDLLLRRDCLAEFEMCWPGHAVLQMITGGFRHGMFTHMLEEHLRQVIHHGMLRRVGLAWPPPQSPAERYWSSNSRQQVRNRQIYHGLRLASLSVINRLIGQAMEEAANQEAVKIARRFRFWNRYSMYRAAALHPRAMQLMSVFPALSLAIYAKALDAANSRIHEATQLVEAGAPLKKIADLMSVPMAFRKVKPAAADLALFAMDALRNERLAHAYMPNSLPRMKLWLRCIHLAKGLGPEFVEWVAKHCHEIGGTPIEVLSFLSDLTDWITACHRASVPPHIFNSIIGKKDAPFHSPCGEQFIVRAFSPDMSLKTVTKLSSDWHEAVANNMSGPLIEFPEPWCCAGEPCGYEIVPITTSADLYREGHALHHCVGTQGHRVHSGEAYFYSIRRQNERIATLELLRRGSGVGVGELRGSCNSQVPKEIVRAIKSWLRSQGKLSPCSAAQRRGRWRRERSSILPTQFA